MLDARRRRAFAVLQDKYVHARRLVCCPAMDLVAVLTVDGQLIVHRTISWQRLLHVKPSEVGFDATTIEWSPNGLFLALGCDEGEVVVFEIETGEQRKELRSLKKLQELQHRHAITAMHWVAVSRDQCLHEQQQQHTSYFDDRAHRFIPSAVTDTNDSHGDPSVLVTADASGCVAFWWLGSVYLAKVDVRELYEQQREKQQPLSAETTTIESVRLASDLSRLFVVLRAAASADPSDDKAAREHSSTDATAGAIATGASSVHRQLVALDLSSLRAVDHEIAFVARMTRLCHATLNDLVLALRQVASEWKTATRIMELKLSLLGSLYEKYACEDPPQVDMLAVVASGITSPALAQYFAQDIQEMSIARMQKLLQSGCETITALLETTVKTGLVALLFHLSELRGRAKWHRQAFEATLGICTAQLDALIALAQDACASAESFAHAVHETRQDLLLFFQWLLERIRIHTNAPATAGTGQASRTASGPDGSTGATASLLNQRRLCAFLQRAAHAALQFRDAQPPHSKFRVETTFGNLVSKQLAKPSATSRSLRSDGGDGGALASPSVLTMLEALESKWFELVEQLTQCVASTITIDVGACVDLGDNIDDVALHFRRESDAHAAGAQSDGDDDDDDGAVDALDVVDWGFLTGGALAQRTTTPVRSQLLLGVRSTSRELRLLRASWSGESPRSKPSIAWDAVTLRVEQPREAHCEVALEGVAFYGDQASEKTEQLAYVLTESRGDGESREQQDWLYVQSYDQLAFTSLSIDSSRPLDSSPARLHALPTLALPMPGNARTQHLATSSSSSAARSGPLMIPRVLANAKRGVLCVSTRSHRLTILDAEDDDDDEEEEEEEEEAGDDDE